VESVAGLLLDVDRAVQQPAFRLELPLSQPDLVALGKQQVNLPALGNILTHRVSQAERDAAEHNDQNRRAAGEMRSSARHGH
jgi:hypothetical protein